MDQIQIDADSHKNLPPMTLDNADPHDSGSDSSSEEIQIDQDSVLDCESESSPVNLPENLFGAFTDNEIMTRVEGVEREAIVKSFVSGMGEAGKEIKVVALHRNLNSGLTRRARFDAFRVFTEAVARKCGGNPNIRYGCFGGSKDEIAEILIRYGCFGGSNLSCLMKVLPRFLSASKMAVLDKLCDDYREKRISLVELNREVRLVVDNKVLAVAIKMTKPGFNCLVEAALARFLPPSQMKILSGLVKDYNTKKISPSEFGARFKLIVDGKVLASAIKLAISQQTSNTARLKGPDSSMCFTDLLPFLERSLSRQKMALLTKSMEDVKAKKISRAQMIQRVGLIVGTELLNSAYKSYKSQQQNER